MVSLNQDNQDLTLSQEDAAFVPPSINGALLLSGESYCYYSPCPPSITTQTAQNAPPPSTTPCVLGIDEAGRGPVLGPMVYSAFYLPCDLHHPLLARDNGFADSKTLTTGVRSNLMQLLCTPGHELFESCGWAVKVLSARDISSGMMRPGAGAYNLNAQAMDATVQIIRGIVEDQKVDIREAYIDTIGNPLTYQQKLERIFPSLKITVAKKADALYPCVSAASVAAKVTRDVALDHCYETVYKAKQAGIPADTWGSGYPSDSKCVSWLRQNMDPVFGWGTECRFSWGTAKEMLEMKGGTRVDWPADEEQGSQLRDFLVSSDAGKGAERDELREWYGRKTTEVL